MEKLPEFKRPSPDVVGTASPKRKTELQLSILERFGEHHYKQFPNDGAALRAHEYDKREVEKIAISLANEITNDLRVKSGLAPFDVPEQNIHVVPDKVLRAVSNSGDSAVTLADKQAIFIDAEKIRQNLFIMASVVLHEIIHLKQFEIEQLDDAHRSHAPYRSGFEIDSTFKKDKMAKGFYRVFTGLNEAVVATMENKFVGRIAENIPELKDEIEWLKSHEAAELKEKVAHERGVDVNEIFWISRDGKFFETRSYVGQRQTLQYLVETIYQDNKDKFASDEAVMWLFFVAHFNGKILGLAKLIENSFGKESFRILGTMDKENISAGITLHTLEKRRRLLLAKRK